MDRRCSPHVGGSVSAQHECVCVGEQEAFLPWGPLRGAHCVKEHLSLIQSWCEALAGFALQLLTLGSCPWRHASSCSPVVAFAAWLPNFKPPPWHLNFPNCHRCHHYRTFMVFSTHEEIMRSIICQCFHSCPANILVFCSWMVNRTWGA